MLSSLSCLNYGLGSPLLCQVEFCNEPIFGIDVCKAKSSRERVVLHRPAHKISGAVKLCVVSIVALAQEFGSDGVVSDVAICSRILFRSQCEWNCRDRWSVRIQALASSVFFLVVLAPKKKVVEGSTGDLDLTSAST